ncbi:MAG: ATP-binding protein [Alphaproteobacteria bacterium]|nr:ATP-binding protein [Alphaproteobacteria bacterium]MDA8009555.1 ATP-binding protein [Alphaproteobacteria bacterium]
MPLPPSPVTLRKGLKRFWPRGLLGRAFILVILPLALGQAFFVYLFYERLYTEISGRAIEQLASEIHLALDLLDRRPSDLEIINDTLLLEVRFPDRADYIPPADSPSGWRSRFPVPDSLRAALARELGVSALSLRRSPDNRHLHIGFARGGEAVEVVVPRKHLLSSTWHVIVLWVVILSLVLLCAALIFLRNQVRALANLSVSAERFGRDTEVKNFRPEGAYEVRKTARAFIRMQERIAHQERKRKDLLMGIAHDLRTPLARIRLQTRMLPLSREKEMLEREVGVLDQLVSEHISQVRGSEKESYRSLEVKRVLADAMRRVSGSRPEVALSLLCDSGLRAELRPAATERCLQNLLDNALRHARSRVCLRARRLEREPDRMEITVDDDGPGIPEGEREAALQPFFTRSRRPLRSSSEGLSSAHLGLGLAIARDLVIEQGGDLTLEGADIGGLRVRLQLPAISVDS